MFCKEFKNATFFRERIAIQLKSTKSFHFGHIHFTCNQICLEMNNLMCFSFYLKAYFQSMSSCLGSRVVTDIVVVHGVVVRFVSMKQPSVLRGSGFVLSGPGG